MSKSPYAEDVITEFLDECEKKNRSQKVNLYFSSYFAMIILAMFRHIAWQQLLHQLNKLPAVNRLRIAKKTQPNPVHLASPLDQPKLAAYRLPLNAYRLPLTVPILFAVSLSKSQNVAKFINP